MFASDYILHGDHRGMFGFSVSCVSIKIKFFHSLAHPMTQPPTPRMAAIETNRCVCIHSVQSGPCTINLWNPQVQMFWNQVVWGAAVPERRFTVFPTPHTHTYCQHLALSPSISIHPDTLPMLTSQKILGKPLPGTFWNITAPQNLSLLLLLTSW